MAIVRALQDLETSEFYMETNARGVERQRQRARKMRAGDVRELSDECVARLSALGLVEAHPGPAAPW